MNRLANPAHNRMKQPGSAGFVRHPVAAAIATAFLSVATTAWAQLPAGPAVVNGTAGIVTNGSQMTITNSPNAILNWQSFSIGATNGVRFEQQNASSQVLNRVVGNDPSSILGSLTSNGRVWLVNPHGVLFGKDARIDVGGLVASTLGVTDGDFLANRFKFEGLDGSPAARVLNQGEINTTFGGRVWLMGDSVTNEGLIHTPGGSIVLAAGKSIEVVDSGLPNVVVRVTAPANEALNLGSLIASSSGSIDLHGGIVNQQGIVRADSMGTDAAGRVVIKAQGDLKLGDLSITSASSSGAGAGGSVVVESGAGMTSVTGQALATSADGKGGQVHLLGNAVGLFRQALADASGATGGGEVLTGGDYLGGNPSVSNADATYVGAATTVKANATVAGDGGKVIVWGNKATRVYGTIEAAGGAQGGNGGFAETSGGYLDARPKSINLSAPRGRAGTWLLDPNNITISQSDFEQNMSDDSNGDITSTDDNSLIYAGRISGQLNSGVDVIVHTGTAGANTQAGDIRVAANIEVTDSSGPGSLTLEAHGSIRLDSGVTIRSSTGPMPVTLIADSDGNGSGTIFLAGSNTILTDGGNLFMKGGGPRALNDSSGGNGIFIESGSVLNAGTGSITLRGGGYALSDGGYGYGTVVNNSSLLANSIKIEGHSLFLNNAASLSAPAIDLTMDTQGISINSSSVSGGTINLNTPTTFTMSGVSIPAGGQSIVSASTLNASGPVLLQAGESVSLNNASSIQSQASGNAIVINSGAFRNTSGSAALSAPQGRWLVYTIRPELDVVGGLPYDFIQFNAPYATTPALSTNGLLYADPLEVQVKLDILKSYDGTLIAPFSTSLSNNAPTPFVLGQLNSLVVQGSFLDKNAGLNKPVLYSGNKFFLTTDTEKPVFGYTFSYTGDLSRKLISATGITAADKVYDGTRIAALSGVITGGVIAGDDVSLVGATGTFDTKNVGTDKLVTISGGVLGGPDGGNYTLEGTQATTTADITPKPVSTNGITAADKVYDGTRVATLSGSLSGLIAGDDVSFGAGSGTFDTKNVGTDKVVTLAEGGLTGADAGNYLLSGALTTTADITPKPVTLGIGGTVSKEYDATTAATLSATQYTLDGLVANDSVSVSGPVQGTYDTANVGTGKLVTATGAFQISGADAPNYFIGSTSATGNVGTITPATLTYNADLTVRELGVPITGFTGTVTGFKGPDTIQTQTSGALAWTTPAASGSSAGLYPIDGGGLSASNYVFTQAPGNASALSLTPTNDPTSPARRAAEDSVSSTAAAVASIVAALSQRGAGGVFDIAGSRAGSLFGPVNIGGMSQDELLRLLDSRKDFKRKLFADAVYKLEIDPSLADVRLCSSAAEGASGLCRNTPEQVSELHAKTVKGAQGQRPSTKKALPQIERKIGVFFGVNDYADKKIPKLENALPDVDAVSKVFAERLGYEVKVVRNPTKADIIRTLNELAAQVDAADSVVVYYAGHGYSVDKSAEGYWLPSDAPVNDPSGWISNNDVARLLAGVRSRQMALITDSCYAGAFAREGMASVGRGVNADEVLTKRSVVVLSSGGDEPVSDEGKDGHSIFAWNLMKSLSSVQNWNPGSNVFEEVQAGVRKEFPQTPKYGSITSAGHQQGGDYLFEQR